MRKVWVDETRDFTQWLSQEENLRLLSDEIGIKLTLVQTEAGGGRYKVDILAKDEIQKAISDKIEWIDATIVSRILIQKQVSDVFDRNQAENYYKWLYEKTILFQKVFGKYIKEYKNNKFEKNLNIKS